MWDALASARISSFNASNNWKKALSATKNKLAQERDKSAELTKQLESSGGLAASLTTILTAANHIAINFFKRDNN